MMGPERMGLKTIQREWGGEDKTVEEEMCLGVGVFMHACRAFLTNLSCVLAFPAEA